MKRPAYRKTLFFICLITLAMPLMALALPDQGQAPPPPIGPPLVREGTLAVHLQRALAAGSSDDEVEAESNLAALGIMPRNGWIADYPVTPDIIGELYKSVRNAATAGKLPMGAEEAQSRLAGVIEEMKLPVKPADGGAPPRNVAPEPQAQGHLNDYYADEGPPIITYYAPPAAYYQMYTWVPYPFWWGGFWLSGFFILNDFHRTVFIENRAVFISNHFRDVRRHRVFRIDPYQRYRGHTYSGIGAHRRDSISTGIPRSDRTIFNRKHIREAPGGRREHKYRREMEPGMRIENNRRDGAPQTGILPGRALPPRGDDGGGFDRGGGGQRR